MTRSAKPTERRTQRERVAESSGRLLQAALDLIAEQGFERTTAVQIGERAGLSKDMVRVRYGSKEALLEALLESQFTARVLPDPNAAPGIDSIVSWAERLRDQLVDDEQVIRAFFTLFFEASGPIPALRPWAVHWLARSERIAADAVRAEQLAGTVPSHIDADVEGVHFVACGVGLAMRWLVSGDTDAYRTSLVEIHSRFSALRSGPSVNESVRKSDRRESG